MKTKHVAICLGVTPYTVHRLRLAGHHLDSLDDVARFIAAYVQGTLNQRVLEMYLGYRTAQKCKMERIAEELL